MSINTATITGNLGNDANMRVTANGTRVLTFDVAVNSRVPDGNGGWKNRADWVRCTLFGKRAESLEQYLTRGTKVAVTGHLHQEKWEKNGETRSTLTLTVDDLDFMSNRDSSCGSSQMYGSDVNF